MKLSQMVKFSNWVRILTGLFILVILVVPYRHAIADIPDMPNLTVSSTLSMPVFPVRQIEDTEDKLSFHEILTLPGAQGTSRNILTIDRAALWQKFRLRNDQPQNSDLVLYFNETILHDVAFYLQRGPKLQEWKTGLNIPYSKRPDQNVLPVFRFSLAPGEEVIIAVKSFSVYPVGSYKLILTTAEDFAQTQNIWIIIKSVWFGAVAVLVLYNLLLAISLRQLLFAWYVANAFCVLAFFAGYSGAIVSFDGPAWWHLIMANALNLAMIFANLFAQKLLRVDQFSPILSLIMRGQAILFAILFVLVPIEPRFFLLTVCLVAFVLLTLIITAIKAATRGDGTALHYASGICLYSTGMLILVFINLGFLPHTDFTRNIVLAGILGELFIFALALSRRVRLDNRQLRLAREDLLKQQQDENQRLEAMVKTRTQELASANKRLEELSRHDGLTGLLNRRSFDGLLQKAAKDKQKNSSLVLLDLDHFKAYNDHLGHPAGDDCLREIATILQQVAKEEKGYAIRFGGEEFAVFLPDRVLDQAVKFAQNLRAKIQMATIPHAASPHQVVTASFGVAHLNFALSEARPEVLVARADKALYRAKETGRNRVMADFQVTEISG